MLMHIIYAIAVWLFADLVEWSAFSAAPFILRLVPPHALLPVLAVLSVLYIVQSKFNLRFKRFI